MSDPMSDRQVRATELLEAVELLEGYRHLMPANSLRQRLNNLAYDSDLVDALLSFAYQIKKDRQERAMEEDE